MKTFKVIGWIFTIMLGVIISDFIGKEKTAEFSGYLFVFIFLGIIPLSIGYGADLVKKTKKPLENDCDLNPKSKIEKYKIEALKLAKQQSGIITVVDIAVELNIPVETANRIIDELYSYELLEVVVTEKGAMLYKIRNYYEKEDIITNSAVSG